LRDAFKDHERSNATLIPEAHPRDLRDESHVDQPLEMHRVGDRVTVFYNPDEPGSAVVNKGITFSMLLSPIFAFFCLILVIWALMRLG